VAILHVKLVGGFQKNLGRLLQKYIFLTYWTLYGHETNSVAAYTASLT